MTTDTPGFSGEIICAGPSHVEEAIASSILLHAEGAPPRATPSLRVIDAGWNDNSAVFHDALNVLTHAVPNAAKHKNVPVQPQFHDDIARDALRMLSADDMVALVASDASAINKARFALSHALDVVAATIIANLVAHTRGIDNPSQPVIAAIVEAFLAEKPAGSITVWPDLMDAALKYATVEPADA